MSYFKQPQQLSGITETVGEINDAVRPVSTVACAYHGYKRTKSVGWALAWAAFGGMMPVIAPTVAIAQGFSKPKTGG